MGRDKATLAFGESTLIKQVYDVVRKVFSDIIVVSSIHKAIDGVDAPIVPDLFPFQSPMVGVATALVYSTKPSVFVVACDMPFLSADAVRCVISSADREDITIPMINGLYEPLHALYRRCCLAHFLRLIGLDKLKITEILPYVAVKVIEDHPIFLREGLSVFYNINTDKELSIFKAGERG